MKIIIARLKALFKSRGTIMEEKLVATMPAPCGNDKDHAYWESIGWNCPRCFAKAEGERKYKEKEATLNRLADKIAERMKSSEVIR